MVIHTEINEKVVFMENIHKIAKPRAKLRQTKELETQMTNIRNEVTPV